MSRKHFKDLAEAIRNVVDLATLDSNQHRLVAQAIADVCEHHNRNFDYHRFLTACGVKQ